LNGGGSVPLVQTVPLAGTVTPSPSTSIPLYASSAHTDASASLQSVPLVTNPSGGVPFVHACCASPAPKPSRSASANTVSAIETFGFASSQSLPCGVAKART
jgi:hypothetical protein